ncbi:UbiA prenyltransferase [Viridothelium virens]|uniref:UbiA prenyltransferase n=1 Tax=Viridothelium virens TaxID=1048519 RepID=A0A6A6HL80_VIRVR|nr:UbiA prenyltransferase [Viridothelium virens]
MHSNTNNKVQKNGRENFNGKSTATLAQQYGGNHKLGWLAYLPDSWLPYVQLARLSPPAGLFLIYFPHVFGFLSAAIILRAEPSTVAKTAGLNFGASFFVSNAIHIWNDLIDAPLDALVERTRNRPIPRGAVSKSAAAVFTATQALGAAVFLFYLPVDPLDAFLYSAPGILAWTYYPWAKKHMNAPQVVLGFCLAWGIIMGSVALGANPFNTGLLDRSKPYVNLSALCLFLANIVWTIIYDTIYAHQDLEDDVKAGIKSLAVLFRDQTKLLLWPLLALMAALLIECGRVSDMGIPYYGVAVGGSVLSLGSMIALVDLTKTESCWWWFGNGFWYAGGFIAGGLLMEYVLDVVI